MRRGLTAAAVGWMLTAAVCTLALLGLAAGSEGWSFAWSAEWNLVSAIRAPRGAGALLTGALLGLAGAIAQGLFRNPLADPYLLGSAAGAGLGVVLVLAAGGAAGGVLAGAVGVATAALLQRVGVVGAAFCGALAGVTLTLTLARGAGRPLVLLLGGVVVGILLGALSDLVLLAAPDALAGKQQFLLGSTTFIGWPGAALLAAALSVALPLAARHARALDALVLGDASARSLGVDLQRVRLLLVTLMALATGAAVAQAGLVAFVGLVAPHLVRRLLVLTHRPLLLLSTLAGAVLLGAADLAARSLVAPQELPVGLLTAVFGGVYLLLLLRRRGETGADATPLAPGRVEVNADVDVGAAVERVLAPGGLASTPAARVDAGSRATAAAEPALQGDALTLLLAGRRAVDGVSLDLHAGQWVAIVGPNGAGKSSLLALLAGLRTPDGAGSVRLHGRPIGDWPARQRAEQLAWLSQHGEADGDIAVRDVVRLGRLPRHGLFGAADAADEAAVDAAMVETACAAFAGRRLNSLSGGERQRVLLARAFAVQAQLLLLDEPTTHLDAPHQRAVLRALAARARAGAAVVAVLHDLTLALAADRVLVMAGGRLLADGHADDKPLRDALVAAFDGAFTIERLQPPGQPPRWLAVPAP